MIGPQTLVEIGEWSDDTLDSHGRPAGQVVRTYPARGWVSLLSANERAIYGRHALQIEAAARVDKACPVSVGDRVTAPLLDAVVAGPWRVAEIRPQHTELRLLLVKENQ